VAALARELKAALLSQPRRQQAERRRPEWCCNCGVSNWQDRCVCRVCAAKKPATSQLPASPKREAVQRAAARGAVPSVGVPSARTLPAGSVWAPPAPASKPMVGGGGITSPTPAARRAALAVALEAVKAAGGCGDLEQSVSQALSETVQAAADSRPLGARLDSCKARAAKAEARLAQTAASVEQAVARHEEAARELEACQSALAELEREVTAPLAIQQPPVAAGAQELLLALEQFSGGLPESVLGCMQSLHTLLGSMDAPGADASMVFEASGSAEAGGAAELLHAATLPEASPASTSTAIAADDQDAPGTEGAGLDRRRDRAGPY
jgi:hypothetical protein